MQPRAHERGERATGTPARRRSTTRDTRSDRCAAASARWSPSRPGAPPRRPRRWRRRWRCRAPGSRRAASAAAQPAGGPVALVGDARRRDALGAHRAGPRRQPRSPDRAVPPAAGARRSAAWPRSTTSRASTARSAGSTSKTTGDERTRVVRGRSRRELGAGRLRRRRASAVSAAQADLEASEASLHDTQVSLAAEVALGYVELRSYQARLAISREQPRPPGGDARPHPVARPGGPHLRAGRGAVPREPGADARADPEPRDRSRPVGARPGDRCSASRPRRCTTLLAAEGSIPAVPERGRGRHPGGHAAPAARRPGGRAPAGGGDRARRRGEGRALPELPALRLAGRAARSPSAACSSAETVTRSLLGSLTAPIFNRGRIRQPDRDPERGAGAGARQLREHGPGRARGGRERDRLAGEHRAGAARRWRRRRRRRGPRPSWRAIATRPAWRATRRSSTPRGPCCPPRTASSRARPTAPRRWSGSTRRSVAAGRRRPSPRRATRPQSEES